MSAKRLSRLLAGLFPSAPAKSSMSTAVFIYEPCEHQNRSFTNSGKASACDRTSLRTVRDKDHEPREKLGPMPGNAGFHDRWQIYFARMDRMDPGISIRFGPSPVRCHGGSQIPR